MGLEKLSCAWPLTSTSPANPPLRLIGKGAAKLVYASNDPKDQFVYCTPRHFWKKRELIKEARICETLREQLQAKHLPSDHLLLNISPITFLHTRQQGISMPLAQGDLSSAIRDPRLPFLRRLHLGAQLCDGLRSLHAVGATHGDLKTENVLLFQGNVKLCDWGKLKTLSSKQEHKYVGNRAFSPPEFVLSHKGEVYSIALILICLFEEAILSRFSNKNTLLPIRKHRLFSPPHTDRGISTYLCENAELRTNPFHWGDLLRRKTKQEESPSPESIADHRSVLRYIWTLRDSLVKAHCCSTDVATRLCHLLEKMTQLNPQDRPSAQQASSALRRILALAQTGDK